MGTYLNADGLYIKTGTDKTSNTSGAGEYVTTGAMREIEIKIDLTTLASTPTILSDVVFFPAPVRIEEVSVVASTAATSSGSGTIDIGLIRTDRSTAIDYDGLVAQLAKTSIDALNEKTTFTQPGGAGAGGALIGTTTANVGYLTANYNTAVYQTGVIVVRIRYTAVY